MLTFNFHIGDWLKKTVHLSDMERSVYLALLCRYYDSEAPIPEGEAYRVALARTEDQKSAVDYVLAEFFALENGCWTQTRASHEIAKYHEKSGKASAAAKTRWDRERADAEQEQSVGNADAMQTHSEGNADGDADAMPTTNHEPRTTNHDATNPKPLRTPRASRLAENWELPSEWASWALANTPAVSVILEAPKFRDYWVAKSGKDATKNSWEATWRNWCRRVQERASQQPKPFLTNSQRIQQNNDRVFADFVNGMTDGVLEHDVK